MGTQAVSFTLDSNDAVLSEPSARPNTLRAGETQWPQCTIPYAPPEVVCAALDNSLLTVRPSHDIWGLGVVAYEAITQRRALLKRVQVLACARGEEPYPWDVEITEQPRAWRHSRLRPLLMPCLARDPALRPRASAVLEAVSQLVNDGA